MFLKIGVYMLPFAEGTYFFPLFHRLVTLSEGCPLVQSFWVSHSKVLNGTISILCFLLDNKNEWVEIAIVVDNKIEEKNEPKGSSSRNFVINK